MQLTWLCCIWKLQTSSGLWLVTCYGMSRSFITQPIRGLIKSGVSRCNIAKWVAKFSFPVFDLTIIWHTVVVFYYFIYLTKQGYLRKLYGQQVWRRNRNKQTKITKKKIKTNQNCPLSNIHTKALKNRYL